jgi:hypothetical protein
MRHLILAAIILLSLSACSPWQYLTVNSTQLTRNDYKQLVFENDTMQLTFDIAGKDGEVNLRILNKTNQPISVNWLKSAFIRNQQSVSFDNKKYIVINGRTRYADRYIAPFMFRDTVEFIPPGVSIGKSLPNLASTGPLQTDFPDSLPEKKLIDSNSAGTAKFKQVHYDEANAPIRFSCYLTFSIGNDNKVFTVTRHFYVSDVYQADDGPGFFFPYYGHGNQIFIRTKTSNPIVGEGQPTASSRKAPTSF